MSELAQMPDWQPHKPNFMSDNQIAACCPASCVLLHASWHCRTLLFFPTQEMLPEQKMNCQQNSHLFRKRPRS